MWKNTLQSGFFLFVLFSLMIVSDGFGQNGRSTKRAALRTRNKQISRFTVRTDFSKSKKYISFGGGAGITNYFGDLAPRSRRGSSDLTYTRSYTTGFYLYRVHPNITLRGSLTWMRIRGDDYSVEGVKNPDGDEKGRFVRNLSFRNNIYEIGAMGIFELFPTDRGFLRRSFINPYGIFGLSFFRHNPQTKTPIVKGETSKWVDLKPLGTEGQYTNIPGTPKPYSLLQIAVPIGFGVRYRLADKWDLGLEFCYRFVFTDYIDDVSGKYPADTVYQAMVNSGNELGVRLSNRSAETNSAITGKPRIDVIRTWKGGNPIAQDKQEGFISTDPSFRRVNGNENGAAPRGNKRRDYWLCTTVNLAYILEIKQKPPKFR